MQGKHCPRRELTGNAGNLVVFVLNYAAPHWERNVMDQHRADDEETENERRTANMVLLAAAVVVVVAGIWLVNALVDARKSEECFESGRRNCNPISLPDRN